MLRSGAMSELPSRKILLFIGFGLYLFALLFRLPEISVDVPQPDEQHWLARMHDCVRRWRANDPFRYNTHLGHPGVTPVLVMLGSRALWTTYNELLDLKPEHPLYVDELAAIRAGNAVVSALVVPALFAGTVSLLGVEVAVLASALFATSPSHIAASRLAHLDGILALVITCTVLLYAAGERLKRPTLTLLAGVFWGLGIATKPTAGFLVVGLLLYRLCRFFLARRNGERESVFRWLDVWVLAVGHGVFALLYTRLWQTTSRYVKVYHIDNAVTRTLNVIGETLENHLWITAVLIVCGVLSAMLFLRQRRGGEGRSPWAYHVQMIWLFIAPIGVVLSIDRDIPQNIIRYWIWAAGLSEKVHDAYGLAWEPSPFGYGEILLVKLPLIVLLGVAIGIPVLLARSRGRELVFRREQTYFLWLCLFVVFTWAALLNVSSKQTIRYVVPVLPLLFVFGAFGLISAARLVTHVSRRAPQHWLVAAPGAIFSPLMVAVIAFQMAVAISWAPYFSLFSNSLEDGLKKELENGHSLPVVGTTEVIEFLDREAQRSSHLVVMVIGDIDILRFSYERWKQGEINKVAFIPYRNMESADYLLVFPGFQGRVRSIVGEAIDDLSAVLTYRVNGLPMMTLYSLPVDTYQTPVTFSVRKAPRNIGRTQRIVPFQEGGVVAYPTSKHGLGYIFFGLFARVGAGTYRITVPVGEPVPRAAATTPNKDPIHDFAIQLEFGDCARPVKDEEIRGAVLTPISFTCKVTAPVEYYQLRGFWPGNAPIQVGNPVVQRVD